MGRVRVLVVDDDSQRGRKIERCLSEEFESTLATSGGAAHAILIAQPFDVVVGANDLSPGGETDALLGLLDPDCGFHARTTFNALDAIVQEILECGRGLDAVLAEIESAAIAAALEQQGGNGSATARQLKLARQTFQDRVKKHGL